MQLAWLTLAVVATVGYHLVLKVTPANVNPILSLAATYLVVAVALVTVYLLAPAATPAREAVKLLNWTVFALAAAIIFLDVGFLMLYRSGFDVSLGRGHRVVCGRSVAHQSQVAALIARLAAAVGAV